MKKKTLYVLIVFLAAALAFTAFDYYKFKSNHANAHQIELTFEEISIMQYRAISDSKDEEEFQEKIEEIREFLSAESLNFKESYRTHLFQSPQRGEPDFFVELASRNIDKFQSIGFAEHQSSLQKETESNQSH